MCRDIQIEGLYLLAGLVEVYLHGAICIRFSYVMDVHHV